MFEETISQESKVMLNSICDERNTIDGARQPTSCFVYEFTHILCYLTAVAHLLSLLYHAGGSFMTGHVCWASLILVAYLVNANRPKFSLLNKSITRRRIRQSRERS